MKNRTAVSDTDRCCLSSGTDSFSLHPVSSGIIQYHPVCEAISGIFLTTSAVYLFCVMIF